MAAAGTASSVLLSAKGNSFRFILDFVIRVAASRGELESPIPRASIDFNQAGGFLALNRRVSWLLVLTTK